MTPTNVKQSGWCDNIRAVRNLAQRDQLDETTLATLERRYCVAMPGSGPAHVGTAAHVPEEQPHTQSPNTAISRDCADLWTMAVLARAGRMPIEALRTIDGQVALTCAPGAVSQVVMRWPDGQFSKSGDVWWYPNGRAAKSGVAWWYPNGRLARNGSSLWYPNGKPAKVGSAWLDPDNGKPTSSDALLAWWCPQHADVCNSRLPAMRNLPDDAKEAGVLELLMAVMP